MEKISPIRSNQFYGTRNTQETCTKKFNTDKQTQIKKPNRMPRRLLGPTHFWQEFYKQAIALNTALEKSNEADTLCVFAYEETEHYRKFIVAHPEVYWFYSMEKAPEKRCSYEVIPQDAPCWLYLDLEFSIILNPHSDGCRMTDTLINIICAYLLKYWNLPCNKTNIMNLDSTSDEKFSRHLIFSIKYVAFENNYHVGKLVKTIHSDIIKYLQEEDTQNDILNSFEKAALEELFVETKNGRKMFVDTGVYTKNRHFRTYLSTKRGKNSYLKVAPDCKHVPLNEYRDPEMGIFLDSLISYFPHKKDLLLLQFPEEDKSDVITFSQQLRRPMLSQDTCKTSPFPKLDEYIRKMIFPGIIRSCKYLEYNQNVIYEICGNRYCENIGREHKSNNVFWVVQLNNKQIYQKCHDVDCSGYKSAAKELPKNIVFQLENHDDDIFDCVELDENVILQNKEASKELSN